MIKYTRDNSRHTQLTDKWFTTGERAPAIQPTVWAHLFIFRAMDKLCLFLKGKTRTLVCEGEIIRRKYAQKESIKKEKT